MMAGRRPNKDGMVRRRKSGRWEGRIVIGHKKDGTPIFKYMYADNQQDLMRRLTLNREKYRDVDMSESSFITLKSWMKRWIKEYKQGEVRESTIQRYQSMIDHYVIPFMGNKKVHQITIEDLQQMYQWVKHYGRQRVHPEKGTEISDSQVYALHCMMHLALNDARIEGRILSNPAEAITMSRKPTEEMRILDRRQLDIFMDAIQEDPEWRDLFYTEITTGLRRGEICGLMWIDFDDYEGTLHIRRAVTKDRHGKRVVGKLKTEHSNRVIVLPDSTADYLAERRQTSNSEWIFPDPYNETKPIAPDMVYRQLKIILDRAGLPEIRFHDLRHTFATHALTNGVDAKTLSGILGHAKASFTLDRYTHVTDDMKEEAATAIGAFLDDLIGGN